MRIPEVDRALAHVRSFHPSVTRVSFSWADPEYDDIEWHYSDDYGHCPPFSPSIDQGVLKEAADAVYVIVADFPFTYRLEA